MVVEYRNETRRRIRFLQLLAIPFMVLVASVLISFFDVFGKDAVDLVRSVLRGNMTRLGDFLIYVVVFLLVVGGTGVVTVLGLYTAILKPDTVVRIDPERSVVSVHHDWPVFKSTSADYRFDEVEAIELRYDDEQSEILMRLPDRKRPVTLLHAFRHWSADAKMRQFKEMGLPVR